MTRPKLLAYVDEAGQRSNSASSSDHFVMSAVVWKEEWDQNALRLLADIRQTVGRGSSHLLHFVKLSHHDRIAAADALGSTGGNLVVVSVCICKRELPANDALTEDITYLWCYRLLLERLSWIARDTHSDLSMTLAHVVRFKKSKLREYEHILKHHVPDCQVAWDHVPRGAQISTPRDNERLQLADLAASATFQAFEPRHGFVERRYLAHAIPAFWKRRGNLLSYGLKVHPRPTSHGAYSWCHEAERYAQGR